MVVLAREYGLRGRIPEHEATFIAFSAYANERGRF